jgi:anion-transporting  ArsA/GET3 family ATPase
VFAALRRITGVGLLDDLTTFFQLIAELLGGFRERAAGVHELLTDQASGFLIVTSPERAAVDEAIFFARELDREGMHRAALILNRVHPACRAGVNRAVTATRLAPSLGLHLAEKVARTHADVQQLAHRDQIAIERLGSALDDPEPIWLTLFRARLAGP